MYSLKKNIQETNFLLKKYFFLDLTGPSENYWQVQAERRRIALKNTLEENKELSKRLEKLEEENRVYKEMLNETRALVEVLQVILYLYYIDNLFSYCFIIV